MRYQQKLSKIDRFLHQSKSNYTGIVDKLLAIKGIGIKQATKIYMDNRSEFKIDFAIAAILKNEAPYLREWIEFHKLIGVQKFYLFDNESTDNLDEVVRPYCESGIVELKKIRGKGRQLDAYSEAIKLSRNEAKWLAIIDIDEFILPITKNKSVVQMLDESNCSSMLIGWMIYGSNGYKYKQSGLVTDIYRKHATDDFIADYKSIINPRKVLKIVNPHYFIVAGKTVDENGKVIYQYPYIFKKEALPASKNKIRINHYYSKSLEEFKLKSNRGYADEDDENRVARNLENFKEHDQNDVSDDYIDGYVDALKSIFRRN